MKTKHTFMLLVMVLVFSFTNSPGIGKSQAHPEQNLETKLSFENGSEMDCRLQTRNSTLRNSGGGKFTVSVNSNWSCR